MGEANVLALPTQIVEAEFAASEHHLRELAVDHVAIGIENAATLELVELAFSLEPLERRMHHEWVQHAGVADGIGVLAKLFGGEVDRVVERRLRKVFTRDQPKRRAGRVDVALGVLRFAGGLVGFDLESLDERRVDPTHHDRNKRPQTHGDNRHDPAAAAKIHHKENDCAERNRYE